MRIITVILLTILPLTLFAEVVNERKAYQTANAFLRTYTQKSTDYDTNIVLLSRGNDITGLSKSDTDSSAAPFYVYGTSDGSSFVIISGNDAMKPILAYSKENSFNTKNIPDNLQVYLDGYASIANYCTAYGIEPDNATAKAWNSIEKDEPTVVALMETAKWGQKAPFYNKAPMINGVHCVSGCVATAMAIIANYYKYPIKGTGNMSYQSATNHLNLSATFDVEYDWNNMLLDYTKSDATEAQNDAVATLMYHMGVLAEMDYGIEESAAYPTTVAKNVIEHMGFDNSAQYHVRTMYTDEEWNSILQNELSAMRPIFIASSRASGGGHAYLLDGYNSDGMYHVNWGSDGYCNGYFDIDIMDFLGDGHYVFNCNERVITNLFPAIEGTVPTYRLALAEITKLDLNGLKTQATHIVRDEPFTINYGLLANFSILDFSGDFALAHLSKNGEIIELISSKQSITDLKSLNGLYSTLDCTIHSEIADGDYIAMVYKHSDDNAYSIVTRANKEIDHIILSADGSYSMASAVEDIKSNATDNNPGLSVALTPSLTLICDTEFNTVTIYNISGNTLYTTSIDATNSYNINDLHLESGIYIVKVNTAQGEISCKVIKP